MAPARARNEMLDEELTARSFDTLVGIIVRRGDRMTYCQMYSDNPHLAFDGGDAFLNPDIGQGNIHCDPRLSGFNELVFRGSDDAGCHYITVYRAGGTISVREGTREEATRLFRAAMRAAHAAEGAP